MSMLHNSTRVDRLAQVRDKATGGPRSDHFKASIIKKWLCVVLCLVFVSSALSVVVPQAVHAAEEGYLFDRVITWADGTTEHVQIGKDNFFYLDGLKKHLVGMNFIPVNPNQSETVDKWSFWLPANMAFFEKQFAYLQSIGVRIICTRFDDCGWAGAEVESTAFQNFFALLKKYKMLAVFQIPCSYKSGFNDAMINHTMPSLPMWGGGETLDARLNRQLPMLAKFDNIVAIGCENELDYLAPGMTYNADDVTVYMTYLIGMVKNNTPLLTTHNVMDDCTIEPTIKQAALKLVDIPSFDPYRATPADITTIMESTTASLGATNGWWALEIGENNRGRPDWEFDENLVTGEFIDASFEAGATASFLFTNFSPDNNDKLQYFDSNGDPKPNLTGIAAEISRLQAPLSQPVTIPSETFTITASASANGSISPTGNVVINQGGSQTFTITTDAGYHVADVLVDGASMGAVTSYTIASVTADHTIRASFASDAYTINASACAHGSISPSGAVTVDPGTDQSFNIAAEDGYHVGDVLVDGGSVGAVDSYTFSNVTDKHTISASFAADAVTTFTVAASAGANGSISPTGNVVINQGGNQTFTITPDAGYHISDVLVDGASMGAVTSYTIASVTADHTIRASFASDAYTINASAGANGSISPTGNVVINQGGNQTFAITPDAGYHVADVLVDGASVGVVASYTFSNVTGDHAISASFAADAVTTFTITASAGAHGSISPSGAVAVNPGADQSLNIAPDAGYHVADVLVDGGSVGAVTSYTFSNVTAAHTISASFAADVVTTFTITASADANGSISPSGAVAVNPGADQYFTIAAEDGYHVSDVMVDGASVGAVASYALNNVTADHTISASFAADALTTFTVTASATGSGDVAESPVQTAYPSGASVQLTATADPGWSFAGWSGDLSGSANPATVTMDGNKTVTATFAIATSKPSITVTSPNGGETASIGEPFDITWDSSNVTGNVNIYVSRTAGSTWTLITPRGGIANGGNYSWPVTAPATAKARVKVASATKSTIFDASNANFTISAGTITVTSPNGGETAYIGDPLDITWDSSHVAGNVNIYVSRSGGSTWTLINPRGGIANSGNYSWAAVTGPATAKARVKVASASTATVFGTSNANFTISAGTITVTSPNGGETASIGEPLDITWDSSHVTGNVNIYVSRTAGSTWTRITPTAGVANTGNYSWTVTTPATAKARVKVASVSTATVFDTSNANFTISAGTVN